MFKVISAEIKKMVSKPSIFVLAVLLAVILVLGVFIYQPQEKKDTTLNFGSSINSIYNTFVGDNSNRSEKAKYDSQIEASATKMQNYKILNDDDQKTYSYKDYIAYLQNKISDKDHSLRNRIQGLVGSFDGSIVQSIIQQAITGFNLNLQKLKQTVQTAVDELSVSNCYPILTTEKNYTQFVDSVDNALSIFDKDKNLPQPQDFSNRWFDYEQNCLPQINNAISSFIYPSVSENLINKYSSNVEGTRYYEVKLRLSKIYDEISRINSEFGSLPEGDDTTQKTKINDLCNEYINVANTYTNLVNYELINNAFSFVPTNKQPSIKQLAKQDEFSTKTNLMRYSYIFDHNLTEVDFALPLTIGSTSNTTKNGYDYAYFTLRLFSFIIIAYAIMATCHSVAGEVKEGSMRYLAIRPVSRTKLMFGKLLAVILMSTIMIIFSTIIAMCVGGFVYGLESAPILTIFNGTTAITLHPLTMVIIYSCSMLIELIVYATIAMLLSCLLKSDLLSVTIVILLYLVNTIMPAFVANPNSWLAFYPFSHISLYSLFGSSVFVSTSSFINAMLGAKIFTNTSLWLTLTVVLVITIVVNILSAYIFKNKEL